MDSPTTNYVKYPRTYHLPWSSGTSDDKVLPSVSHFVGQEVVVTEKMDGENCLDGSTPIQTSNGTISLKELCDRHYRGSVLAWNHTTHQPEMTDVEADRILQPAVDDEWYEIETETGEVIRLTGEHQVWLPDEYCYRSVRELRGDERLLLIK